MTPHRASASAPGTTRNRLATRTRHPVPQTCSISPNLLVYNWIRWFCLQAGSRTFSRHQKSPKFPPIQPRCRRRQGSSSKHRYRHQSLTDSCGTSEHLISTALTVHHGSSPGQSTGCPGAFYRPRNHHKVDLSPIPRRPHYQSYLRSRHIYLHRAPADSSHRFTAIRRYASRHESLFDSARDLQLWHIRRVQE
jgi:hypothetical protein